MNRRPPRITGRAVQKSFFERRTQQDEADMFTPGDDAGHCSNGLTAQKFRDATPEERTVYRKWLRGMIVVYGTLLLMSGVAAVASYSVVGPTQLTKLSTPHAPASPRTN
jgi:hypothetical protein